MSLIRTPPTTESPPRSNNSSSPPAQWQSTTASSPPQRQSPSPIPSTEQGPLPENSTSWDHLEPVEDGEHTGSRDMGDTGLGPRTRAAFTWTTTRGCGFNIQDGFGCIDASAGIELWSLFRPSFCGRAWLGLGLSTVT